MDVDNRVQIDGGSEGRVGQGRAIGENWDKCNRSTIKKSFQPKKKKKETLELSLFREVRANSTLTAEKLHSTKNIKPWFLLFPKSQ